MIIRKIEAKTTKLALQDIAKLFGDNSLIISNTRNDGRNIVYFALDSLAEEPIDIERRAKALSGTKAIQKSNKESKNVTKIKAKRIDETKALRTDGATDLSAPPLSEQVLQLSESISQLTILLANKISGGPSSLHQSVAKPDKRCLAQLDNDTELRLTRIEERILDQTLELKNISLLLQQQAPKRPNKLVERDTFELKLPNIQDSKAEDDTESTTNSVGSLTASLRIVLTERYSGELEVGALLHKPQLNALPNAVSRVCVFAGLGWKLVGISQNEARTFAEQADLVRILGAQETGEKVTIFIPVREYLDWLKDLVDSCAVSIETLFTMKSESDITRFLTQTHNIKLASQYRIEDFGAPPASIFDSANLKASELGTSQWPPRFIFRGRRQFGPLAAVIGPAVGKRHVKANLVSHILGILCKTSASFCGRDRHV